MVFAQFYQYAVWPAGSDKLIEACGDRSVIVYDGRVRLDCIKVDAAKECQKRGYKAFAIFKGDSFTRSNRISEIEKV